MAEGVKPPANIEAEKAVLGACLLNVQALVRVKEMLKSQDFYYRPHQLVYSAICGVHDSTGAVDEVLVYSQLYLLGTLEEAGGGTYLGELTGAVPTSANAEHYAALVRDAAVLRRQMVLLSSRVVVASQAGSAREFVSETLDLVADNAGHGLFNGVGHVSALAGEYGAGFRDWVSSRHTARQGLELGIIELDRHIPNGLEKDMLAVVGARSGDGKTSFLLSIAVNVSLSGQGSVLIVSLETRRERLMRRIHRNVCPHQAFLNAHADRNTQLRDDLLTASLDRLGKMHIAIEDSRSDVEDIKYAVQGHCVRHPETCLVGIDYFQRIGTKKRFSSSREKFDYILGVIDEIKRAVNRPIILLSQFTKGEINEKYGPNIGMLKETGRLENDADVVMLLWNKSESGSHDTELRCDIPKQRDGPRARVMLRFIKPMYLVCSPTKPRNDALEIQGKLVGTEVEDYDDGEAPF